jgi:dipeptidyl-peptidase-4
LDSINYFPRIKSLSGNSLSFYSRYKFLHFNIAENSFEVVNEILTNAKNITASPDLSMNAYTIKNNLFLSTSDNQKIAVTSDLDSNFVSGQSVSRQEFGITKGIFWAPNSKKIAFYRKDESAVTNYPLVDITSRPAHLNNIKYPMNGMGSEVVYVGIYNIKKNKTIYLKTTGEKNQYLPCVTWGPESKYIYLAHLNRLQNKMELYKYDSDTGVELKKLFVESSEKYVEPEHDLVFLPNSSDKFLWFSKRDGWQHLYLYNTDGKLLKQVTKGNWNVLSVAGFLTDNSLLISATKDSPIEENYYVVNISDNRITRLTNAPGVHRIKTNFSKNLFIDSYTNFTTPRVINIIDADGNLVKNLLTSPNPIAGYKLGKQKIFTIQNKEGIDLYCRITYPVNFDSTKKYPAIVYVYGGPHVQLVKNSWGYGRYAFWFQKMAEKGYFVFTLDNRGSDNRGLAFEQATWHQLGTKEIEDQLTGVSYLKSLPYIDSTRFGVFGWSYGGFMTTSLMLRTNNTFKVGVAGGAVIDWRYYEVMYGERYMGTDATNHAGMEKASLLNYVQNLNGRLLMVHGTMDPTVVWQHTLMFLSKATHLNKHLDYYPYVGSQHGVYGQDAVNLYQKLTEYFLNNL